MLCLALQTVNNNPIAENTHTRDRTLRKIAILECQNIAKTGHFFFNDNFCIKKKMQVFGDFLNIQMVIFWRVRHGCSGTGIGRMKPTSFVSSVH